MPIAIVANERLAGVRWIKFVRPYDSLAGNIVTVINPFHFDVVPSRIMNKDQVVSWNGIENGEDGCFLPQKI
jgi:hypothetical protein